MIGIANYKYLTNDFEQAENLAKEIIKKFPIYTDPYNLLGNMYQEKRRKKEAAEYFFLAAYI